MSFTDLPTIAETVRLYNLAPKKSLGQNFLFDLSLTRKIARLLPSPAKNDLVLEVGPGPGSLTRALLLEGKFPLLVIERDARCIQALEALQTHSPQGIMTIVEGDALQINYAKLCPPEGHLHIAANLPYNISTELLMMWCENVESIASMTLMFQKEVAERLVASPGCKAYGRLSVLVQAHFLAHKAFDIPPQAFYPPPKITSSVVTFSKVEKRLAKDHWEALKVLTKLAFSQRRKMLRTTLKPLGDLYPGVFSDLEEWLGRVGAQPTDRAENISVPAYSQLAATLISGAPTALKEGDLDQDLEPAPQEDPSGLVDGKLSS